MGIGSASAKAAILVAVLTIGGCGASWTPPADFFQKPIVLLYPSGPGSMGYTVQRLLDQCKHLAGSTISWEKAGNDAIMTCDGANVMTKVSHKVVWQLQPIEDKAVAIVGLAINGYVFSRLELEGVASSL